MIDSKIRILDCHESSNKNEFANKDSHNDKKDSNIMQNLNNNIIQDSKDSILYETLDSVILSITKYLKYRFEKFYIF